MNPGSDPDRDDFGLPPVDIVIPDDARELDRDVQAYQRELRALRRRAARQPPARPADPGRDGAAAAGRLPHPGPGHQHLAHHVRRRPDRHAGAARATWPRSPRHRRAPRPARPPPGRSAGRCRPGRSWSRARAFRCARSRQPWPPCWPWSRRTAGARATLRQLGARAAQAHVAVYFVVTADVIQQVSQLAAQARRELRPGRRRRQQRPRQDLRTVRGDRDPGAPGRHRDRRREQPGQPAEAEAGRGQAAGRSARPSSPGTDRGPRTPTAGPSDADRQARLTPTARLT